MMVTKKVKSSDIRLELPSKKKGLLSLLAIRDERGKVIGRLDIRNKSVVFSGKCDSAARAFFQATKSFITEYIQESLTPKPKPEEVKEDESRLGQALRTLHLKKSDVLSHSLRGRQMVVVTKNGKKLFA